MSFHDLDCPNCGATLTVESTEFTGGVVQPNVVVVDHVTPAKATKVTAKKTRAKAPTKKTRTAPSKGAGSSKEGGFFKSDEVAAASGPDDTSWPLSLRR